MGVIGVGQITLFDQNDSPQALISNEAHPVPSNSDGSSPNLSGAISTFLILLAGVDITNLYTVTATPSSGITGMLSTYTYTVSGMTSDTGYVDFTAARSGFATITKRFSLSKMKQGLTGNPGASGQDAPRCLGLYAFSAMASITGMISGDLAVLYSSDSNRGVYQYSGSSWSKLSSPTKDQVTRCFIYILDAVRQGYGTSTDYAIGSTSFETILANFLFVAQVVLAASGWLKSANYAETGGVPTAGFMLDALNQVIKAYGAVFVNAAISGTLTSGGTIKGDHIKIEHTRITMWSGASATSPAVDDFMLVINTTSEANVIFYNCVSAGSWTLRATFAGTVHAWGDHTLKYQSTGSILDYSESNAKVAYMLRASTNSSCIGEMYWSSSSGALPSRGTWLVVQAYNGNGMTIAAGGTAPYSNYQAIRI
jgi:hypothetical protein